jgi:chemotaxis protein MotB
MIEDDPPMGVPEWIVTFGDMMSLLLTFFIMLVSMSEMKKEEQYKAMVDSIQKEFGYNTARSAKPGRNTPSKVAQAKPSTESRAKQRDTLRGGMPIKAPVGEDDRVRIIRPGEKSATGTVVFFEEGTFELSSESIKALDAEVLQLTGKPQKIEIRGHTSQQLAANGPAPIDAMDLGYRRCRTVMQYLVEKHQIPPERIRLASAGAWEPMTLSSDPNKLSQNPRVEVFLLEETVDDLVGSTKEREQRVLSTDNEQ